MILLPSVIVIFGKKKKKRANKLMTKKLESILNSDVFLNKIIVRISCYYWTDPKLKKIYFPRSLSPYPLEMKHLLSRALGLSVMCFSCVSLHTFYTRAVCPVCSSTNLTQDLVFVSVFTLKTNKAASHIGLCLFQVVQTSQLRGTSESSGAFGEAQVENPQQEEY